MIFYDFSSGQHKTVGEKKEGEEGFPSSIIKYSSSGASQAWFGMRPEEKFREKL